VLIVGVNFSEPVLRRRRKVEGIGSPEIGGDRSVRKDRFDTLENGIRQWQKPKIASGCIGRDLGHEEPQVRPACRAFPHLSECR